VPLRHVQIVPFYRSETRTKIMTTFNFPNAFRELRARIIRERAKRDSVDLLIQINNRSSELMRLLKEAEAANNTAMYYTPIRKNEKYPRSNYRHEMVDFESARNKATTRRNEWDS